MTVNDPRHVLRDLLKPHAPKEWRFVIGESSLDAINVVTVKIKQQRITRLPVAPNGAHLIGFVVSVISPLDDFDKAEDQLDDAVNAFIHQIDAAGVAWSSADKAQFADRYLCYDIALDLTSTKE